MLTSNGNTAVVRELIDYIQREELKTGDRLPSIRQLAKRLRLGPNVVRDGVLKAQTMGLIRIHPRSGAFVQSPDFSHLVDALEQTLETALQQGDHNIFHLIAARRLLEAETVARAASKRQDEDLLPLREALQAMAATCDRAKFIEADERFHIGIATIAGNPVLVTMLRALLVLLRPYRLSLVPTRETCLRTQHVHERIYASLVAGEVRQAREAMREHLTDHRDRLLEQVIAKSTRRQRRGGEQKRPRTSVS